MAHFALVENNLVVKVIVAEQEYINTLEGTWVQTSYNTRGGIHYQPDTNTPSEDQSKALRKNYAGIGANYDESRDAFIIDQPYPSWTKDIERAHWISPVGMPPELTEEQKSQHKHWAWDKENQEFKLITMEIKG